MEKFIHQENLALYKKRLAETHSEAEREMLLKLLAEERNKEDHPKQGSSSKERTMTPRGDECS